MVCKCEVIYKSWMPCYHTRHYSLRGFEHTHTHAHAHAHAHAHTHTPFLLPSEDLRMFPCVSISEDVLSQWSIAMIPPLWNITLNESCLSCFLGKFKLNQTGLIGLNLIWQIWFVWNQRTWWNHVNSNTWKKIKKIMTTEHFCHYFVIIVQVQLELTAAGAASQIYQKLQQKLLWQTVRMMMMKVSWYTLPSPVLPLC